MAAFLAALVAAAATVKFGAAQQLTCAYAAEPVGATQVEGGGVPWASPVTMADGILINPDSRDYRFENTPSYLLGGSYISSKAWPGLNGARFQLTISYTAPARIYVFTTESGIGFDGGMNALLESGAYGFSKVDQSGSAHFKRSDSGILVLWTKLVLTGNVQFIGPLEGTVVAGVISTCENPTTVTMTTTTMTTITMTTTTLTTTTMSTSITTRTTSTSSYTGTSSTVTTSTATTSTVTTTTATTTTKTTTTTSTSTTTTTTLHSVLRIDGVVLALTVDQPGQFADDINNQVDPPGGSQETLSDAIASALADSLPGVEPSMVYIISAVYCGNACGSVVTVEYQIFMPFEAAYEQGVGARYFNETRNDRAAAVAARLRQTSVNLNTLQVNVSEATFLLVWSDEFYDNLRTTTLEMPPGGAYGQTNGDLAASGGVIALVILSLVFVCGGTCWLAWMFRRFLNALLERSGREVFAKLGRRPTADLEADAGGEGEFDAPNRAKVKPGGRPHVSTSDVALALGDTPVSTGSDRAIGFSLGLRSPKSNSRLVSLSPKAGSDPVPSLFGAPGQGGEEPHLPGVSRPAPRPEPPAALEDATL